MADDYRFYEIERRDSVAWVFMNRPEKRNACGPDFWRETAPLFEELDRDDSVRAIVLAGRGKSFCAGLDLMAAAEMLPQMVQGDGGAADRTAVHRFITKGQTAVSAPEVCRKPVIAAIHGFCVGAGLDFIVACDVRLCTADAVFSVREARMAIIADVGVLQRLPRIVGEGWARQLVYTGEDFGAELAERMRLVNAVYPDADALYAAADELAQAIAANAPLAVQGAKQVLNFGRGRSVEDGLEYVAGRSAVTLPSEDLKEAVMAFMEKRPPSFKGR